jgi:hypothetical protein
MTGERRRYTDDVPDAIERAVRDIALALPDAYEERAWVGTRWLVRKKNFAHVLGVETDAGAGPRRQVVLAFRSAGEELEMLRHAGPPFIVFGWGRDAMGIALDEATDWDEVGELIVESYCTMAPKKLVALVDRPAE